MQTYRITDEGLEPIEEVSSSASDELSEPTSSPDSHVGAAGPDLTEKTLFSAMERAARRKRDARMKADQALDEYKAAEFLFDRYAFRYVSHVRAQEIERQT